MKKILLLFLTGIAFQAQAQHSLTKIWETDPVIAVPESVLFAGKGGLYVSLIDGNPWDVDGKGGIGRMSPDGKILDSTWITGLNSPKGMGINGNRLYVADVNAVVVIDIKKGTILKKITWDSAKALNDVTIDNKGIVFVSDSKEGKVWRIENDRPELYLDNMPGTNGLRAVGNDLLIAAGKSFVKADAKKQVTKIADLPQGGDGVEPVGNGDYIVTSWAGYIFYVHANGNVETLLETHAQEKNTADIGYDAQKRMVYVPTFYGRTVAAYRLE